MSEANDVDALVRRCREIIDCDTARISTPCGKMFLVIGFKRNTKDDDGQWFKDGERCDFDYIAEKTVASGDTEEELLASVREYKRLCGMTMVEYLRERSVSLPYWAEKVLIESLDDLYA